MAVTLCLSAGLPWILRGLLAAMVVAFGGASLWRYVLLRGPRSLRALEWSVDEPTYGLWLGQSGRRLPACADGCRRYGAGVWLLRFQTREGVVGALVDARCQDPRAIRRLSRQLSTLPDPPAGRVRAAGSRQADTMTDKV